MVSMIIGFACGFASTSILCTRFTAWQRHVPLILYAAHRHVNCFATLADLQPNACVNQNALFELLLSQANIFLASESYFSTLVAVTSPAVKIVPLSASQTFFDRKLCNGMGLCALEDRMSISDEQVSTSILEDLLLHEDVVEEDASTSS